VYPIGSWIYHDRLVYAVLPGPSGNGGGADATSSFSSSSSTPTLTVSTRVVNSTEFRITQGGNASIERPVFSAFLSHPPHRPEPSQLRVESVAWAVLAVESLAAVPHALEVRQRLLKTLLCVLNDCFIKTGSGQT
jgi:hypothetical protein